MVAIIAGVNYALAGLNVYFWAAGANPEIGAINLGIAVFAFGAAHMTLQVEGWKHQR